MQDLKRWLKPLFFIVLIFVCVRIGYAQQSIHISGTVKNNISQKTVEGVSIVIAPVSGTDSTGMGIASDQNGRFDLFFNYEIPFKLIFNHVSFYKEVMTIDDPDATNLSIELAPKVVEGEEVVVTSNLVSKEELSRPITTDRVSTVDVEQLTSFSVFDLVSGLREVDVATQSMTMQSVNTRGFNASANKRFLQLSDGVDNQAPGLSFPIGNLIGVTSADVASVEILPGPSSARYGSSALNGVLLTNSKDPFEHEGFTFKAKGGVNEFRFAGSDFFSASGNVMHDFSGRFAKSFSDKIAFKVTTEVSGGTDWKAQNYDNIGPGNLSTQREDQPGYNGVNIYGDENYEYLPVGSENIETGQELNVIEEGALVPVTRTGYKEASLVDYDIATRKFSGAIHYKINEQYRLNLEGKYGFTNSLYTGDTRVRLDGFKMYQGKVDLSLGNFDMLGYSTLQNSGQSYDVSILADHLINAAKSDVDWYRDLRIAYNRGVPIYNILSGDYGEARDFADSGSTLLRDRSAEARYIPGTERFNEKFNNIKKSTSQDSGAAIRDNSKLYHLQSSYKFPSVLENSELEIGGNFRFYDISSNGTVFPDTAGNNISNYEFGGFASINSQLFDNQINSQLSVRIDKNERFQMRVSPALGLSYTPDEKNYFRLSYQNGFRYPGLREQFINKNLAKAKLVGGLSEVVGRYDLAGNSITTKMVEEFNDAVTKDINETLESSDKYSRQQAEIKNLSILEKGILDEGAVSDIKSETANTFEAGFKRLFTERFYLDLNYYISLYNNFIGITRVVKPRTSPSLDLYNAARQVNNTTESDTYYVYSNAEGLLAVHGLSFGLDYSSGGFLMGLNGTWTNLFKDSDDPIVPGFNTPPLKLNFEWGHRQLTENVGFKMVYRLRTKHEWQSPFVDGTINTHGHFDFQFNVDMPATVSNLKFGVTNFGVEKYYNIYGGPSIGTILFASITFNPTDF